MTFRIIKLHRILTPTISLLLLISLSSACVKVGPDYRPPSLQPPSAWQNPFATELKTATATPADQPEWWSKLGDPLLTKLITDALKGNLDLKQAQSRVREARARRGGATADRYPTLDANGAYTRSKSSGVDTTRELFSVGFDAGWEVDLFGGVRRSVEAAEADWEASQEQLNAALVSLAAEVAVNYYQLRVHQNQLRVAEKNLESQNDTYNLAKFRCQAGLVSTLDLEKAKYNLEDTRSRLPTIRVGLEESHNNLAVLLGVYPGALPTELSQPALLPTIPPEIAVGIPAEVLGNRPDIRVLERKLAAQNARIGVASAEYYPKLSLLGSIGLEALSADKLWRSDSNAFSFGPRLSWNIFNGGAIKRNIEVQDELYQQALLAYEAGVLSALSEVENALAAFAQERERLTALTAAEQSARSAADLALKQYSAGLSDFQSVLETQRSLLAYQQQLEESKAQVIMNLIKLYKALGGGWKNHENTIG